MESVYVVGDDEIMRDERAELKRILRTDALRDRVKYFLFGTARLPSHAPAIVAIDAPQKSHLRYRLPKTAKLTSLAPPRGQPITGRVYLIDVLRCSLVSLTACLYALSFALPLYKGLIPAERHVVWLILFVALVWLNDLIPRQYGSRFGVCSRACWRQGSEPRGRLGQNLSGLVGDRGDSICR